MLPLAVLGIVFLVRARHSEALILLLVVPVYYLCVQSFLHTEYRYVLAIHYFLFVFVGVALHWAAVKIHIGRYLEQKNVRYFSIHVPVATPFKVHYSLGSLSAVATAPGSVLGSRCFHKLITCLVH